MSCDKCAYCGSVEGLEWHHILPRSLGGTDEAFNLIRVCNVHHALLHGMSRRGNIGDLTSAGMQRSKESGTKLGQPLKIHPEILILIAADRGGGMSISKMAAKYSIPKNTLHTNLLKWGHDLDGYRSEYDKRQVQYGRPTSQ